MRRGRTRGFDVTGLCLLLALALGGCASRPSPEPVGAKVRETKGARMPRHAKGNFDVKLNPQPPEEGVEGGAWGRMSLAKEFHGDLEAVARGEMLAVSSAEVKGSAGYVAMERVSGALHGRKGTFALMHRGVMTRGEPELSVTVVPDSGTGELVGLAGTMAIDVSSGHAYDFEYTLPERP